MGDRVPFAAGKRVAYRGPGVADHSTSEWICWRTEFGGVVLGSSRVDRLIVDILPIGRLARAVVRLSHDCGKR